MKHRSITLTETQEKAFNVATEAHTKKVHFLWYPQDGGVEFDEFMEDAGLRRGKASPCVFWHKEKGVRVVVHGDDFTVLGFAGALDWFRQRIQERRGEVQRKDRTRTQG